MGLLAKRTDHNQEVAMLYSVGFSKTCVFVGLGNPGVEYTNTRHNIGFMVLDKFATSSDFEDWQSKKDLFADIAIGTIGGTRVMLVKPTTFMNNSGQAVQAVLRFYKLSLGHLIVIHDEIDLNLDTLQVKQGGGAAGHNGLKSIIAATGPEFLRLRLGIGPKSPPQIDLSSFVLQKFSDDQLNQEVKWLVNEASSLLGEATATDLAQQTIKV